MTGSTKNKGNILLVEKDAGIRGFAASVLAGDGYGVFETEDAFQAFTLSESLTPPLHLLAAEVTAGSDLGGVELSRHLQVLRPGLKVLYLSSVPADPALREELQGALDSYLSKPFTRESLLAKVAKLLAAGREDGKRLWKKPRMDWRPAAEPAP